MYIPHYYHIQCVCHTRSKDSDCNNRLPLQLQDLLLAQRKSLQQRISFNFFIGWKIFQSTYQKQWTTFWMKHKTKLIVFQEFNSDKDFVSDSVPPEVLNCFKATIDEFVNKHLPSYTKDCACRWSVGVYFVDSIDSVFGFETCQISTNFQFSWNISKLLQ